MTLFSKRFFYIILLPLATALVVIALLCAPLIQRESALDKELAELQARLKNSGYGANVDELNKQVEMLAAETARLQEIALQSCVLDKVPLVVKYAAEPFQLIKFEQEKAAIAAETGSAAAKAGVKFADSAFNVLNGTTANGAPPATPATSATSTTTSAPAINFSPQNPNDFPRRRWAQLALAQLIASHAIAAKVATYEALPVPLVKEIRLEPTSPAIAVEVQFCVKVTGKSAQISDFIEQVTLGKTSEKSDAISEHLLIENVLLRKEGVAATDNASATLLIAAFLSAPKS